MAPIRDEANHYLGMVLVNQDITHEVEVERMKADFISMLTHDLKNPLTVILTSAQLIVKGYLGPISPKMESQVKAMNRNAQTMLELVNNFLDVSKIEAGKMTLGRQPMNIMDLVDNVIQNFSNQTEELGIDLVKEIQDIHIPVMTCDPFQVERVLSNLVSNAIKFTSKPGHVIVRVGVEKDNMILTVSDSGEGIPKDDLPSLFSRYFRTQKVQGKIKGTGLGLYIVKSITEAHGGKVRVESELHKGTTFYVSIPIVPPETSTAFS
jgi:signal transduction histidine kinase